MISYASRPHYADHLAPVLARLPADLDVALVASYKDLTIARRAHSRIVLMQHGAGQSYSNDNPAYPGGRDNDAVGLFLVPGEHAASRWRSAYPRARVEVVGSPRLDDLPPRQPGPLTVAVSFHWSGGAVQETGSVFPWYREGVLEVAREFNLIGHGHPRAKHLPAFYAKHGIEYVPTFEEVCERADVYVCDNSSTIFEFAATGRPVVLMNERQYRKHVHHGLRFWDAAHVGVQVDQCSDLVPAIRRALEHRPEDIAAREDALEAVYTYRGGAAQRAADAIMAWAA